MANETVLIVDSDGSALKMAAAVLRREGYGILLSSNGEQALRTLQTARSDLMLVNMTLPRAHH